MSHAGLDEEEYAQLRASLEVHDDTPEARVDLPVFLGRFPMHLRPLVQPLFDQLAHDEVQGTHDNSQGPVAETQASWPVLVAGISRLVRSGASWERLLSAWIGGKADPGASDREEVGVELATALCFWCAHPSAAPGPDALGGAEMDAAAATTSETDALEASLAVLRLPASEANRDGGASGKSACGEAATRLQEVVPCLPGGVGQRFAQALLGTPPISDPLPLDSRVLDRGLAFLLRGTCAHLWHSGAWLPLYRDWRDGRSFNGLLKGSLHYDGPAVVAIRTTGGGEVLGAVSDCWTEGAGRFGGSSICMLFALRPTMRVFPSTERSDRYGYLNSRNKHAPRGLGFGGQVGSFRLWIDADFQECKVLLGDATYKNGPLLPGSEYETAFKISAIEVWGCGGDSAQEAQETQRGRSEAVRNQARQVDRSKLLENEFDKEMFFGNTFAATADVREETGVVNAHNADRSEKPP